MVGIAILRMLNIHFEQMRIFLKIECFTLFSYEFLKIVRNNTKSTVLNVTISPPSAIFLNTDIYSLTKVTSIYEELLALIIVIIAQKLNRLKKKTKKHRN